ncbi:fibronectin type III domain-containing protein 7 [Synchiropus picturatus]
MSPTELSGDLGYVTSFQTDGVQLEAELLCGQLFTLMLHAQDEHCSSEPSEPQLFKTGPCIPHDVHSFMLCEDDRGAVTWAESDGADSYIAIAVGRDGHTHVCTSNMTSCIWDDLHCGEVYTAHIVANDFLCSSLPSNSTTIRMASCIPENLRVELNCSMKVASVSWDPSDTALSYVVTAETNEGHKLQQSTNSTTVFFSEFLCGHLYFLSVQAVDAECISDPSAVMELNSVPCPPADVSSSINCVSNIAVVSWRASRGAEFYTATVMQEDGQLESCWSDIEHCGMSSLNCGMNHSVIVVASDQSCNSDPSEVHYLQSVPCVPKDVDVKMNCDTGVATISWTPSRGATSYSVIAQSSLGATSTCDTLDLNCTLSNLTCGHVFTVQVAAQDEVCSSLPSPAQTFHSVPCTPVLGSVVLDCFTDSALIDWSFTEGAQSYFISARSTSGHVSTCVSNLTHCELPGLSCGEAYEIVAYATNQQCRGGPSNRLQLQSAPCPPEDVLMDIDCSTNTVNVSWAIGTGADFYVVQATGVEAHESSCESTDLHCTLSDLFCGFIYNVSVTAVNQACNVSHSAVTQIHTVPCVPQQVEAQVDCESGALAVSWEPSRGAWQYTAVAQGNGGYASTCNSSQTSCLFSDLLCGLNYTITVNAADGSCSTTGSSALAVTSVPCVPQMVAAEMECESHIGMVTWEEGEGVDSYTVRAVGPDGHSVECHSGTNNCSLPNMHCGQLYNLSVTAQDRQCHSSPAPLSLQSVPCQPTSVRTALQCQAGSVAVTWEHSSGALYYSAVAEATEGHQVACNNTETHCDLIEPLCGRSYNVTVLANDRACSSAESAAATVLSAPCPPQNVEVTSLCEQGAILVTWSHDHDVDLFHVKAISDDEAELSCDTSSSSCTIRHLPCGHRYNVTVTSVRDNCESEASTSVMASSAPCVPQNVMTQLDCVSNSAWVTWDEADGAESYQVLGEERSRSQVWNSVRLPR